MPARVLHTEADLAAWTRFLAAQSFPMTVSQVKGAKRSLPQNETFHMWVGQIAAETGDTQAETKAECKLRFGLPIMERDNPSWVEAWSPLYAPLPYRMRLKLFQVLPLTSQLTTRQMGEFMDAVQKEYRSQGIYLIDPEARKYEAEMGA